MKNMSWLSKAAVFSVASVLIHILTIMLQIVGLEFIVISLLLNLFFIGSVTVALFSMWRLSLTLVRVAAVCEGAAKGDLETRVLEEYDHGIVGNLQRSVNGMLDISDAFVREARGSMIAVAQGRYHRKVLLRGLPGSFASAARVLNAATQTTEGRVNEFARFATGSVDAVMETVSTAAIEMQTSAQDMSSFASDSNNVASWVSAAAEQATNNVQSVASAIEELASSVSEISRQVISANQSTKKAIDKVQITTDVVNSLNEAASRIGSAVQIISDIAGQTNLLALNATIEAARAGEAGKGFAVVASEVKALAGHTSKATEEISSAVNAIQTATLEAIEAIREITRVIHEVDHVTSSISATVEEQNVVTREVAQNVGEAAAGTAEVTQNIIRVSQSAQKTGVAAGEVLAAAADLSKQAGMLKAEMQSQARAFLKRSA